jgi:vacuolar-type H+-ATPase subunit H
MGPTNATAGGDLGVVREGEQTAPHEAMGLLEHASKVAEETLSKAHAEAEQLVKAAREEADRARQSAQEEVKRERERAHRDAEQQRHQAAGEAERILTQARNEVTRLEQEAGRLRSERDAAAETVRGLAARLTQLAEGRDVPAPQNESPGS